MHVCSNGVAAAGSVALFCVVMVRALGVSVDGLVSSFVRLL